MSKNAVPADELRRVQRAMGLDDTPVEALTPFMRTTLAVVARCALNRPAVPLPSPREISRVDVKRLAAGDRD
ncbi:hypothetical protein LV28_12400 [Pandoraea pnomenusa]|uniref:Uncharacterized protein n=1 Tax=Pandoraea pnomenusa TaxID=93220 RepID=A0A378YMC3_9BURK|nr:hypothetical protein [Pandoraea pnomenusa]AIU27217.1 hypothetical protein LV28_12400 [Pandoraea pnomenusa]SUA78274.1 Uncharacterised protein [Pandoraea pnomenusa]SUD65882.1 Uncharacterised protein [Pandoraea pnomenusa]